MESGGGAWPERLRPLQLPRHPPLCDRLTHLPVSLEYPPEHIICCWYDSSSQYPNTLRLWETLSLKGSSCVRGRMAAVWCVYWSAAWALLWSARPYTVTGGDRFIQWEMSCGCSRRGVITHGCWWSVLRPTITTWLHTLSVHWNDAFGGPGSTCWEWISCNESDLCCTGFQPTCDD